MQLSIMKAVKSLEKAVPEASKNLILEIDTKFKGYDELAGQKLFFIFIIKHYSLATETRLLNPKQGSPLAPIT